MPNPTADLSIPEDHPWRAALAAVGIVGMWERDHRRRTIRCCRTAAALLAGDPDLAWQDLPRAAALANVRDDPPDRLRLRTPQDARASGAWTGEYRLRSSVGGIRRVLCRGRTERGPDRRPSLTRGVVIDITAADVDRCRLPASERDTPLNDAVEHGVATYEAIRASGAIELLPPARALLIAIGHVLARRVPHRHRPLR